MFESIRNHLYIYYLPVDTGPFSFTTKCRIRRDEPTCIQSGGSLIKIIELFDLVSWEATGR